MKHNCRRLQTFSGGEESVLLSVLEQDHNSPICRWVVRLFAFGAYDPYLNTAMEDLSSKEHFNNIAPREES